MLNATSFSLILKEASALKNVNPLYLILKGGILKEKQSVETTVIFLNLHGPRPFGFILGKTEKCEKTMNTIKKEGGQILSDRRLRPATSVIDVQGLPIEYLTLSHFWFYLNVLYAVEYEFKVSLDKKEFYITFEKLKAQYGMPIKYVQPNIREVGIALWQFGEIEVELNTNWVSENMELHYRYVPLAKEAAKEEADLSYSSEKKKIRMDEKGL